MGKKQSEEKLEKIAKTAEETAALDEKDILLARLVKNGHLSGGGKK